tara:strand:- start:4946 stop:5755 length:810 start_codon:yes stop_codon:yes gene_type:complete
MFLEDNEIKINKEFTEKGYIVRKIKNLDYKNYINSIFINFIKKKINLKELKNLSDNDILNNFHKFMEVKDLNKFRVDLIHHINKDKLIREKYFQLGKEYLYLIAGNELVMQKRINLSIQLPNDKSSLLPIHSDTWSGDSPYEVVLWIPLVNCYSTKSMYILPPKYLPEINKSFSNGIYDGDSEKIFKKFKKKVEWINIKINEVLIFNQNLPHGNVVNLEPETRWSLNCRFKSIFSPYGDKKIGEFFEPITLRAISQIGMNYKYPDESKS